MSVESKNTRLDFLDIAKAIAIFLVLMGHTGASDAMYLYRRTIYTFHMPLFLMISGMVSKHRENGYTRDTWKALIRKNAFALVVPYFFWGLLYTNFNYVNLCRVVYASWKTINDSGSVLALWYLVCLFLARIEFEGVLWLSDRVKMDRRLFAALLSPVAFAVGLLLPQIEIGYPWEFDVSLIALGFLLIGYALKKAVTDFSHKDRRWHAALFAVAAALFAGGILVRGESLELVLMFRARLGNLFWFFYLSLTGSAAVIGLSMLIAGAFGGKTKPGWYRGIVWVGRNTMGVFVLHKPFLPMVMIPFLIRLGMDEASVFTSAFASLLTLSLAVVFTALIKKYCPALIGARRSR